jgi:hypothetical protein
MADVDDWSDGDAVGDGSAAAGGANDGAPTPQINGGLLDPRTFPSRWRPATDFPSVQPRAPTITGPLMTDAHAEVLQDILNAQAGLRPIPPQPETWSINGRPYLAISAETFDPTRSNGVTSMPTPADSAAATAGKSAVAVPYGVDERTGYIAHLPAPLTVADVDPATGLASAYRIQSLVLRAPGTPGGGDGFDTYTSSRPSGSPVIHGHIDRRSDSDQPSDGMVDDIRGADGYGDTDSFRKSDHAPTATVSHGQIGWHVLDNGQLKFLNPPGSMTSSQITAMQRNLDQEQKKFLRP